MENSNFTPECYVYLLAKAFQKGHRLVQERLKPHGLTNIQYLVLELLWHREGLTATEIGKTLRIDKATLSGVLERMVEAGWIQKARDGRDMRVVRHYPSKKADELKGDLIRGREDANEELLAVLSAKERATLKHLLTALLRDRAPKDVS